MGVNSVRKIAAEMLKCGESRIRMEMTKETEEALTREDVKSLIRTGLVWKVQKKGTSKFRTKVAYRQKKKGRRTRMGSRHGTYNARSGPKKRRWIKSIRSLRRLLKELKDNGQIEHKTYTEFYPRIKGGEFRNKKHILTYLDDHDLLKQRKELGQKPRKAAPAREKSQQQKHREIKKAKKKAEKKQAESKPAEKGKKEKKVR
jgi:large subunit ribosomal protein L19e